MLLVFIRGGSFLILQKNLAFCEKIHIKRHLNPRKARILYQPVKFFTTFMPKKLILYVSFLRHYRREAFLSQRGFYYMDKRENYFESRDIGLLIFVIVAGWLLLFQSGLFR